MELLSWKVLPPEFACGGKYLERVQGCPLLRRHVLANWRRSTSWARIFPLCPQEGVVINLFGNIAVGRLHIQKSCRAVSTKPVIQLDEVGRDMGCGDVFVNLRTSTSSLRDVWSGESIYGVFVPR